MSLPVLLAVDEDLEPSQLSRLNSSNGTPMTTASSVSAIQVRRCGR
jgi:hypothetical protein